MRKLSSMKKVQFFVSGLDPSFWVPGELVKHPLRDSISDVFTEKNEFIYADWYADWRAGRRFHVYATIDKKVLWEVFPSAQEEISKD